MNLKNPVHSKMKLAAPFMLLSTLILSIPVHAAPASRTSKKAASQKQAIEAQEQARLNACRSQESYLDTQYFQESHHNGFLLLSLRSALREMVAFLQQPPAPVESAPELSPQQVFQKYYDQTHPDRNGSSLDRSKSQTWRYIRGHVDELGRPTPRIEPPRVIGQITESSRTLAAQLQSATQQDSLSVTERSGLKLKLAHTLHAVLISDFLQRQVEYDGSIPHGIGAVFSEDPARFLDQSILGVRPTLRSTEADYFVDASRKRHPARESTSAFRIVPLYRTHLALDKGKAWLTLCSVRAATTCATIDLLTGYELTLYYPNPELRHPLAVALGRNKRITAEGHENLDALETALRRDCQGLKLVQERDAWPKRMLSESNRDFLQSFLHTDPTYIDTDFLEKPIPAAIAEAESSTEPLTAPVTLDPLR